MKFISCLLIILAFTLTGFSQISPELKTGFGYMYVFDKDESISPDYHTITGYPSFSIEKPFPIEIRLKKRLSINPGLAWYLFKEERMWSRHSDDIAEDQTVKKDFRIKHQTLNGYIKVMYQTKFKGKTEAFIYGGAVGGMHFITNSKGTKDINNLIDSDPETNLKINENAKDFFGMFYYGAVIGFQPNARRYNFIKPSFELSYFPGFVSKPQKTEEGQDSYLGINTIQFTVLLGFRIK